MDFSQFQRYGKEKSLRRFLDLAKVVELETANGRELYIFAPKSSQVKYKKVNCLIFVRQKQSVVCHFLQIWWHMCVPSYQL